MIKISSTDTSARPKKGTSRLSNSERIKKYFLTQEGNKLDFEHHPYLAAIYNDESKYKVIVSSRQVGKSTLEALEILNCALSSPNESILFATASKDQLSEIRDDKIRAQFELNPQLKRKSFGAGTTNNQSKMVFSNQSKIYFKSIGSSVKSARGIAARLVYFDEVQSIPREHISVVLASARTFMNDARFVFAGTFLHEENSMNRMFLDSCQNEWIIPCVHCGQDNPPLGMDHIDLEKPFLFCALCKEPLDALIGRWVPQNPDNPKVGYRICGLMTPECTWRTKNHQGILDLYESEPIGKFLNETMGLPFIRGAGLITRSQLENLCSEEPMVIPGSVHGNIQQRPSVAAIDWAFNTGASHTIITFAQLERDYIKILYAKRFSGPEYAGTNGPDKVLDEMCILIKDFNSDYVFADYGLGHENNLRLQGKLGGMVKEMHYHGGSTPTYWDSKANSFKVPKTSTLDQVFFYLQEGRYRFPRKSDFESFYSDILNIYTDYDSDQRSKTYKNNGSDDFCQLLNLCTLGIIKLFGYPQTWLG